MAERIDWRTAGSARLRDLTPDIRLFEIEPAGALRAADARQPHQRGGADRGRADTRSYSVVGPCTDGLYRIAVKLLPDSRGGSPTCGACSPGRS